MQVHARFLTFPHTVYLARCLILRLLRCRRRTRFLRHFHLILALAFFQGLDLCAIFLQGRKRLC